MRRISGVVLVAVSLCYVGLKRPPAMLASPAELTFPVIAVIAGTYAYNSHLRWSQWLGAATIVAIVAVLPPQRRRCAVDVQRRDVAFAPA